MTKNKKLKEILHEIVLNHDMGYCIDDGEMTEKKALKEILKHYIPISEVEETTTKLIILIEDSLEKDLENYQEAIDIVEKAYIQYKTNKEEEVE